MQQLIHLPCPPLTDCAMRASMVLRPSNNCGQEAERQFRGVRGSTCLCEMTPPLPSSLLPGPADISSERIPMSRSRGFAMNGLTVHSSSISGSPGAGADGTLKKRIAQMLRFGQGAPVGHWGGRLVWQPRDAKRLQVCWRVSHRDDPRTVEAEWIGAFKSLHGGKRPFANLQG